MPDKSALRRRITPSVPFTLHVEDADGSVFEQSYLLAYDLNAMVAFEEVTGKNLFRQLGDILGDPSIANVSALLWAALLLNNPEYGEPGGLQAVRSNLTFPQLKPALEACMKAFVSQLPKDAGDQIKKNAEATQADPPVPEPATADIK